MYDSDDRVRLPVHIVILLVALLLLFVGGGVALVYSSINHTAPPQITPSPQVQVTASATAHASPTAHTSSTANPTPTFQASNTNNAMPNPYPPHRGKLALNDSLKDNSKGYRWHEATL